MIGPAAVPWRAGILTPRCLLPVVGGARRPGLGPVLLGILLAGCAEPGPAQDRPDGDAGFDDGGLDLQATSSTGLVRGVVFDAAIQPLAEAEVRLSGQGVDRSMTTGPSGSFGFDLLLPGAYLVAVRSSGYADASVDAEVVAGEEAPPYVKVQLLPDGGFAAPFQQVLKVEGFLECTGSPVALCGIPNNYRPMACETHPALCYPNLTTDRSLFWLEFPGNVSFLQAEMTWTATSDVSESLAWNHVKGAGCDGVDGSNNVTRGPSPLVAPMVDPVLRQPGGPSCVLYLGVSAGPLVDGGCVPGVPLLNEVCPGVAVEQGFTIFAHGFYGYVPLRGWQFGRDGGAPPG